MEFLTIKFLSVNKDIILMLCELVLYFIASKRVKKVIKYSDRIVNSPCKIVRLIQLLFYYILFVCAQHIFRR